MFSFIKIGTILREKSVGIKIGYLFFFVFIAAIFISAIVPITSGDTGYHLKTGERILENLSVPLYDIFSYTAQGARWIAHYWLSDVFFYLTYLVAGYWGLIFFVALIAAVTYGILYATARLNKVRDEIIAASLGLYGIFMVKIWSLWVVRPQIFGFLFGALILYLLEKWRLSQKRLWLYFSVPVLLVWANLHASVVLGIALVALYIGLFVLRNIKFPKTWIIEACIAIAAALSTLANPNGYKILIYNFIISPIVDYIGIFEWRSLFVYLGPGGSYKAWLVFGFMLFILASISWRLSRLAKESLKKINWEWVFLAAAAFVLPMMSVRHVGYFPIMTFPVFAWCFENSIENIFGFINKKISYIVSGVFGLILLVSGMFAIPAASLDRMQLPEGAVEFILNNKPAMPLYNTISQGSYLIWKLWPEYKVFVDGRSEVYSKDLWKEFKMVAEYGDGWQEVFNKYDFNTVVLTGDVPQPGRAFVGADLILAHDLAIKQNFVLVYWDDASFVLVRDIPENKGVIEKYGYKIIGPYNAPQYIQSKKSKEAAEEIYRALKIAPDSSVIARYAQEFMATH